MNDNVIREPARSLKEQFSSSSEAWKEQSDPIFRFWALVRLLHYDGVLQPIRNLLRFLQIDTASRYSQKKKEQKENEKPSPVVDKPAP